METSNTQSYLLINGRYIVRDECKLILQDKKPDVGWSVVEDSNHPGYIRIYDDNGNSWDCWDESEPTLIMYPFRPASSKQLWLRHPLEEHKHDLWNLSTFHSNNHFVFADQHDVLQITDDMTQVVAIQLLLTAIETEENDASGPAADSKQSVSPINSSVSFISWNLDAWVPKSSLSCFQEVFGDSWHNRFDLMVIIEISKGRSVDLLSKVSEHFSATHSAKPELCGDLELGQSIFFSKSKFDALEFTSLHLPYNACANATKLYHKATGSVFWLIAIHLKAWPAGDESYGYMRRSQLEAICQWINENGVRSPVFFAGDFNEPKSEGNIDNLMNLFSVIDVYQDQKTFHPDNSTMIGEPWLIDFCLIPESFTVNRSSIVKTGRSVYSYNQWEVTDHYPLIFDFVPGNSSESANDSKKDSLPGCKQCLHTLDSSEIHWATGLCNRCYNKDGSILPLCNTCAQPVSLVDCQNNTLQCYRCRWRHCTDCRNKLTDVEMTYQTGLCNICYESNSNHAK